MKKVTTLILFILISTFTIAQNHYQDVVYLKNGSIIRGVVIEQVPNESIKIETADKSIFVYQMDEIQKITKEEKPIARVESPASTSEGEGLQSGYRGIAEFGYQFGLGTYGMDRLKINLINGGQISPYFFIGGGTGLRYYFDAEAALIPVFVHARANVLDKKVSPYFALSVGYTFNASNDFETVGLLVSPATGVTFNVSESVALNVGLSYELQSMEFYDYYYYGGYSSDVYRENSGALSIDFALSF
ncbi:hypothetical protein POV26_11305 [Aequorivita todarodis]|uniref:hypothetical protein n=1 Tax=Aequorivita todarodis TaxID=2036821 RepID=UPI00235073D9|nr:hypothetical protein [Aequorivita todarodis]MDC8001627.1 hypothetical protein [Aequorivita todarodis]